MTQDEEFVLRLRKLLDNEELRLVSEKRFHQFGLWVIDNPNFNGISIADLVDTELMSITEVVDLLNEQQATIKSKDKQLERLYNYFQDYLKDEMSGNAFSEMWDFVKEDERWEDELQKYRKKEKREKINLRL